MKGKNVFKKFTTYFRIWIILRTNLLNSFLFVTKKIFEIFEIDWFSLLHQPTLYAIKMPPLDSLQLNLTENYKLWTSTKATKPKNRVLVLWKLLSSLKHNNPKRKKKDQINNSNKDKWATIANAEKKVDVFYLSIIIVALMCRHTPPVGIQKRYCRWQNRHYLSATTEYFFF